METRRSRAYLLRKPMLWGLYVVGVSCLFSPGLIWSEVPAFRDAYHFYYPQAVWLDKQAAKGDYFPQWDRHSGLGTSVPAQCSYALYYPLRLIWFTPISVAQRFSLFCVIHIILAGIGAALAAHKLRLSPSACFLAGVSYSLSCPVLFQHNNLIYLTSAAWIGFLLAALIDVHQQLRWIRSGILFSFSGSMMLLAGDPHTLANALLIGAVLILAFVVRSIMSGTRARSRPWRKQLRTPALSIVWFTVSVFTILVLTHVQWIPTLRFSRLSDRVPQESQDLEEPRSVRTLGTSSQDGAERPAAYRPTLNVTSERVASASTYDFSLSPWHLATFIWPRIGGHYLPQHSRWFALIPAEGRMWIPSLYLGIIPLLLVLHGLVRRPMDVRMRWLFFCAVIALAASLGHYSIVWLVKEILHGLGWQAAAERLPAASVGSLYWMLVEWVPGYSAFRYPAKWTVWLVIAIALMAGVSYDRMLAKRADGRRLLHSARVTWLVLTSSLVVLVVGCLLIVYPGLILSSKESPGNADRWFGNQQPEAVASTLIFSAVVPLAVLLLLRIEASTPSWRFARRCGNYIQLRVPSTRTLFSSAQRLVIRLRRDFVPLVNLLEMLCVSASLICFARPPSLESVHEGGGIAPEAFVWVDHSEADFLRDQIQIDPNELLRFRDKQAHYQQEFMLGKLGHVVEVSNLNSIDSLTPARVRGLKRQLVRLDRLALRQPELDAILYELGIAYRLARLEPEPGKRLVWQPIENTRPLCEFIASDGSRASVTWDWTGSAELSVELKGSKQGVLLVRQFNDGGWYVEQFDPDGKVSRAQNLENPGQLFIEVAITNTVNRVLLKRRWLW